jgi:hypothetical protein
MGYVPGYAHDIFISYAHGDDRSWMNRLVDRLEPALKQRLGIKAAVWIDEEGLRPSRDFSAEIPDSVESSAVFLLFASPSYIRSEYCVQNEAAVFEKTVAARRSRFAASEFANERFAIRTLILPVDDNEHWSLFPGLTDIAFCNEAETFAVGSTEFETSFRRLTGELVSLLKRMRNHSTSVFLYPPHPDADVAAAHSALASELSAQSYRLLPDRTVNLPQQLRDASMSVFLLGGTFDETAGDLTELAAGQPDKPWVVWRSPAAERTAAAEQLGFGAHLEQLDSPSKTYLNASVTTAKLKEEVLGLLRPDPRVLPTTDGKPRVYLVYNARDQLEVKNAGLISYHFRKQFHFEYPDDPAQHTLRLSRSDGVLLVWGSADEDWCSREFAEMLQSARPAGASGLCLFDPPQAKMEAVERIRRDCRDVYVGQQFGKFDPARLSTFFTPILQRSEEVRR